MSQSVKKANDMGSKEVEELRVLINEKMRYERLQDIAQGLNYASIFMLIFSIITEGHISLFLLASFGVAFFGISSTVFEKRAKAVKELVKDKLIK